MPAPSDQTIGRCGCRDRLRHIRRPLGGGRANPERRDCNVVVGTQRSVPSAFFGFNAESLVLPIDARLMDSRALGSKLAVMPGAILRIPGGTPSQWIDWRTGRLIDEPGSPFSTVDQDGTALTLRDRASIVHRTEATPLWDLNVLTSNLSDQLALLRAAQKLALPVRYVELGNELWDPEAPYVARYPTGASYGTAMNPWISAIHRRFPRAVIAVSGADESDPQLNGGGPRYLAWNQSLLSTVRVKTPSRFIPTGLCPISSLPAAMWRRR